MTRLSIRYIALGSLIWFVAIYWVHRYVDFPVAIYLHANTEKLGMLCAIASKITLLGYISVSLSILLGWFLMVRFVAWSKQRCRGVLFILLSTITAGLVTDILKLFFGRPRPKLFFNNGFSQFYWWHHRPIQSYDFVSFPSGHATVAAAIGMSIILLFPRWRWAGLLLMLAVAASRVILLDHYVADVMGGIYVGTLTSLLFYRYYYQGQVQGRFWHWLEGDA